MALLHPYRSRNLMTRTLPPASRYNRAMRLELGVVGGSPSVSSAASVPASLVHSSKAGGVVAAGGAVASTAGRRLGCRQRRVEGRTGGGGAERRGAAERGDKAGEIVLGVLAALPRERHHGSGCGGARRRGRDVDGDKEEEAVDTEEEEEEEEALRFRRRGAVDGVDGR
ncbi:hypothetical protein ZWY2020_051650 [Hordeum vulgare]|nr:hypothetical protein ZWY2020_051650 [Hordeum vulgare]